LQLSYLIGYLPGIAIQGTALVYVWPQIDQGIW